VSVVIHEGDCLASLSKLPDCAAQCCVTSPPYYGLRDYGVEGQIGLEPTVDAFLDRLRAVFAEVRRVLTRDGTLWLNMGDSYAGSWGAESRRETPPQPGWKGAVENHPKRAARMSAAPMGCKPKDMMLVPERLLLALQADGWWVRDKIVWHKPNPMPSSVRDRFCASWEPVFLLSRSARYFFDHSAAREPRVQNEDANGFRGGSYTEGAPGPRTITGNVTRRTPRGGEQGKVRVPAGWVTGPGAHGTVHHEGRSAPAYAEVDSHGTRLIRNVWTVATRPFADAHFATFPPEIAERCIKVGSRPGDTVLDPFGGAGTTGLVADRLQRSAILCELNPQYAQIARSRITGDAPLLAGAA
jgi:DNA modification methylase